MGTTADSPASISTPDRVESRLGLPVSIFLATPPIALGQAMRAIADGGDTVSAR
jgi:hypothetical protein